MADPEEQKNKLRFVIVGGGPTGVELAGELADLIDNELAAAFPTLKEYSQIVIVERSSTLVKSADPWFSKKVHDLIEKKGKVYTMYDTMVNAVSEEGVETSNGFLAAGMVVWSGGVKAPDIHYISEKPLIRDPYMGRIGVTSTLALAEYPHTYVVGDLAHIYDKVHDQMYPMRAQFAVRQGRTAGRNIALSVLEKPQQEFNWHEKGFIMSLGKGGALAEFFGLKLSGPFAWWLYRTAYLYSIFGLRAKLRTALEWTLNLFSPRDISKI